MIRAYKSVWLERLFVAGLRRVIRKRFFAVFERGFEHLAELDPERPIIACSNHSNWWDGFVVAELSSCFSGRHIYMAIYETLLERYKPLRFLGAFGLDMHRFPLPGVRYALELLRDPRNVVWIFPQGVLVPQWVPIVLKPGATWLARKTGAQILPLIIRYEWLVESRPSIFLNCGRPMPCSVTEQELESAMRNLYDEISPTLAPADLNAYRALFTPKMSMNRQWDRLQHFLRKLRGEHTPFNPRNE